MPARTFFFFDEIEGDVAKNAPPVVYKYRMWNNDFHKRLLTDRVVWFSHPFDLNDPLDVRPPYKFDLTEVHDSHYFDKLLLSAADRFPGLSPDEQRKKAKEQWELTKKDPSHILQAHAQIQSSRTGHDPYGVFSTSMDPESEGLWNGYADDYKGYCIGFKTVDFCRQMKSGFGKVNYCDDPIEYSFLNPNDGTEILYRKKKIWELEKEFRFITAGIGLYSTRDQYFTKDTIAEITLGHNLSLPDVENIMETINKEYPGLPVFKTKMDNGHLTRYRIQ